MAARRYVGGYGNEPAIQHFFPTYDGSKPFAFSKYKPPQRISSLTPKMIGRPAQCKPYQTIPGAQDFWDTEIFTLARRINFDKFHVGPPQIITLLYTINLEYSTRLCVDID